MRFTHLHLHTYYSLLDGAIKPKELMQYCKDNGMDAVAMTDHGNMFGAVEFYKEAKKAGIKPIIGSEFYIAANGIQSENEEKIEDGGNYHLVVLAKNKIGYQNLIKLSSISYEKGFYKKPRIDYDLLEQHKEGLIVLSACIAGEIQNRFLKGEIELSRNLAIRLHDMFPKDHFYLEIQNHGIPKQAESAKFNIELSKELSIPLVLTNDSHFLRKDDREAQEFLLRINSKQNIDKELKFSFTEDFYVKTQEEMAKLFPDNMDAFHNTNRIADMVDFEMEFGNTMLPDYEVPEGKTQFEYMKELSWQGVLKRYDEITDEVKKRFDFECSVIESMGFAGYFLIVQDFINWAKENDIPVGPGRGSAAGSIVTYGLGITNIDPLKYDLLFERFLNPDRKEMPDIDVDFCADKREKVYQYVKDKYGYDKVGQIITYGTMAAKAALKDVARVMNIPFKEANEISSMFPDALGISIDKALEQSKELKTYSKTQPKLFNIAKRLEDNVRHTGIHAAGVVIAPDKISNIVPMASVSVKGQDGRSLVTQYDMNAITEIGLVKMDFLGLKSLTAIDNAVKSINKRTGENIDLDTIPLDDVKTYELLQSGKLGGVFQLESSGIKDFAVKMKPSRFEDIIALIALYRPGPLQSGMAESFINRKHGKEKVIYPHKNLESVLEPTYGVIVYQEQVMQISRVVGGFTPGEADALRKAMGKKIQEKMDEMRIKFVDGGIKQGYEKTFCEKMYNDMAKFASYGFNKSHSAGYGMIVYQTAYLKANYPVDYMKGLLDSEIDKSDKVTNNIATAKEIGVNILLPDINKSNYFFEIENDSLRYGLAGLKGIGRSAIDTIVSNRSLSYTSIDDLMSKVDLSKMNKGSFEVLTKSGSFDTFGINRKDLVNNINDLYKFYTSDNSNDSLLFDPSVNRYEIKKTDIEYSFMEKSKHQKEVFGFYLSMNPLKQYEDVIKKYNYKSIESIKKSSSGSVKTICIISESNKFPAKKNNKDMMKVVLWDLTDKISGIIFPGQYEKLKYIIDEGTPFIITGKIDKTQSSPQLIIDNIETIDLEKEFNNKNSNEKYFIVTVNMNKMKEGEEKAIHDLFKEYEGNHKVIFVIKEDGSQPKYIEYKIRVLTKTGMITRLNKIRFVEKVVMTDGIQTKDLSDLK